MVQTATNHKKDKAFIATFFGNDSDLESVAKFCVMTEVSLNYK